MSGARIHQPVRLGMRGGKSIFKQAAGLHEPVTGMAVVAPAGGDDPEVIFEEHGTDTVCQYFELLSNDHLLDEKLGPTTAQPKIRARCGDSDVRVAWQAMQAAFLLEQPAFVNKMLRELREALQPHGGAATLIRVSPRLQRRTAVIRMLHSAQAQVARPFNDIIGGPHPLQDHAGGSEMFPSFHFVPLVLLGSPFARGFAAFRAIVEVPLTLVLVMMSEQKKAVLLRDADPTWRQLYENTLPDLRQVDGQGTTWLRKTNHHAVNLDSGPLIRWWTTQLNALFTEVTDLGRYRRADGLLDAGNAYRELRSLDRIISNCVRVQVRPDEHAIRVGLAFEFFDLLPNILDRHVGPAHIWQTLANPSTAKKILRAAFSQAPTDIGQMLIQRTDTVLSMLRDETLEHVMPGRHSGGKVTIGAAQDTALNENVFIAKLFHQLRNTHHGYELDHQGKRDLLDAHTGHISQAFPELVVLYVIAILARPDEALAGNWF
jgi:hypothetical protein